MLISYEVVVLRTPQRATDGSFDSNLGPFEYRIVRIMATIMSETHTNHKLAWKAAQEFKGNSIEQINLSEPFENKGVRLWVKQQ